MDAPRHPEGRVEAAEEGMRRYDPRELANFALAEFERGLESLSDDDAQQRLAKADGSEMNSASWTVAHLAAHWAAARALLTGTELSMDEVMRHFGPTAAARSS